MVERDRGAANVEVMIALPLLMVTVLATMQVTLLFFARSIAHAAAQEGVRAGRADHGSPGSAASVARRYATVNTSGFFLSSVTATSRADSGQIRVVVGGQAQSLVPFLRSITVTEQAAGPLEKWRPAP